jgi:hypothetical protein
MNSTPLPPGQPAPPDEPAPSRPTMDGFKSGCGSVLLILLGIVLILPALCSIPFTFAMGVSGLLSARDIPVFLLFAVPIALLCFLGFKLIARAIR